MLKRTIGLSLLFLAGHAYSANIVVTTTADEDNTNPEACSLREAVALINGVVQSDGTVKDILNSTDGYGGCGGRDTSDASTTYSAVIELKSGETYTLTKGALALKKGMTIQSDVLDDVNDTDGTNNPKITTITANRLFDVNDGSAEGSNIITVKFDQVDLVGCANNTSITAICADNGGILSSNENIVLTRLRVSHGRATNGGAFYFPSPSDGTLSITEASLTNNTAIQGGVAWLAAPKYTVIQSLITKNTATDPTLGTILYIKNEGATPSDSNKLLRTSTVAASTLYDNVGFAMNLRASMVVFSSTLIKNTLGAVYANSTGLANIANNIMVLNGSASAPTDCVFASGDQSYLNHNVYTGGCESKDASFSTSQTLISNSGNQLVFADSNQDGVCDAPPANGLLCPLRRGADDFTEFFKPRLLASYQTLLESVIVNKGGNLSEASGKVYGCSSYDQRNQPRTLCDIGAIELVVGGILQNNGKDILYGQTADFDLTDVLGDGELMPKSTCSSLFPNITPPQNEWVNGCLQYVVAPTKGAVTLNNDTNILTYKPLSNFHGFEDFTYEFTTTTSRFSDGANDKVIRIKTRIVQDPPNSFEDKKVNLSGGAVGVWSMIGLMTMALIRRRKAGEQA